MQRRDLELPVARRLDSLTGLRFFAALAVVIYHLPLFCGVAFYGQSASPWGYLGVEFFFLLSGFVLIWSARAEDRPAAFWRRRFARVYPLYLVMFAPGVILALLGRSFVTVTGGSVALSIVMLQAWVPADVSGFLLHNANAPAWSLSNEAFFYAVFPWVARRVLVLSRPRILAAAGAVIAVMVVVFAGLDAAGHGTESLYYFPAFQIGFFLVGMLLGEAVRRAVATPGPRGLLTGTPLWLGVLAIVACGATIILLGRHRGGLLARPVFVELIVLPFLVLLIAAAAGADLRGASSLFAHPWVVRLGVWSYALYLVQFPSFMVIRAFWPGGLSRSQSTGSLEALAVLVSLIAVAGLAHRGIEVPCNARLRHTSAAVLSPRTG